MMRGTPEFRHAKRLDAAREIAARRLSGEEVELVGSPEEVRVVEALVADIMERLGPLQGRFQRMADRLAAEADIPRELLEGRWAVGGKNDQTKESRKHDQ